MQDLYHETYENICVMFASIPNFWDFYQQTTISKHGIECLRLLNEIIGEFDQVEHILHEMNQVEHLSSAQHISHTFVLLYVCFQLLSKPKYSSIDKIKTIGSTYMAAAGLQRSRNAKKKVTYGGPKLQNAATMKCSCNDKK